MWSNELVETIKNIAVDASGAMKPFGHLIGTVVQSEPVEIRIDAQKVLKSRQIMLTDAVRDYAVEVECEFETEEFSGHKHTIRGIKKVKIKNSLKVGETVLILKCEGGQRHIVIGRLEERK